MIPRFLYMVAYAMFAVFLIVLHAAAFDYDIVAKTINSVLLGAVIGVVAVILYHSLED